MIRQQTIRARDKQVGKMPVTGVAARHAVGVRRKQRRKA
jgi:hypothetical protein